MPPRSEEDHDINSANRTHVRLTGLRCGMGRFAPGWVFASEAKTPLHPFGLGVSADEWLPSPVGAFLVEHPDQGLVLIDTGLHPRAVSDLKADFGRLNARFWAALEAGAEQTVVAQLARLGRAPAAVATVVMTHLHVDHASGMTTLPEAKFVISRAEWDAAHARTGVLRGYVRHQLPARRRCELVDFESASGALGFERVIDLFGDGLIQLISTPGHSPGHLSVLLESQYGRVLLAGDAAFTMGNIDRQELPYRAADEGDARRTLRALAEHREAHPETLVIPAHDEERWQRLEALAREEGSTP